MADPVTLTMMAAGTAVKTGADIWGGFQKSAMNKFQAGWARKQAAVEASNAAYARSVGEVKAQQYGLASRQEYGKEVTGFAGSGFRTDQPGSVRDVLASTRAAGEQNEAVARAGAAHEAYGFDVRGAEDIAKAGAFDVAAKTDVISGFTQGAEDILGSGSQVARKWFNLS